MSFNYKNTCQALLEDLSKRTKKVIVRRFGLESPKRETLESIGGDYGITRERVRQIEREGLLKIKPKIKNFQNISQFFTQELKKTGDLRREKVLLNLWGGTELQNHIYFILTLTEGFDRFSETPEIYSLWTIDKNSPQSAQKIINSFYKQLNDVGRPLSLEDFKVQKTALPGPVLSAYLEISKEIEQGPEGLFGLKDWPEINPKGIKDKAYLVFKREKRPLHFTRVAQLIDTLPFSLAQEKNEKPKALPQTVHNELIRDSRFVLVGRGLYGLKEWGFLPGTVLDIIKEVLKESKKPVAKEEVLEKVLKQRMVKENTILLNLANKKCFLKDQQGRYQIKKA